VRTFAIPTNAKHATTNATMATLTITNPTSSAGKKCATSTIRIAASSQFIQSSVSPDTVCLRLEGEQLSVYP